MTSPQPLTLRVVEARPLNPLIRRLTLAAPDGTPLPGWDAGAHLQVQVVLPGGATDWRHYSLVDTVAGGAAAPREYVIAVRRDDDGRGGSRFMHERLREGDRILALAPKNDFPLREGAGRAVLLAGGIGVTPIASMAARRRAVGRPVRLVYAGRSRSLMAFLPELQALLGDDLVVHADDEHAGVPLDLDALLDGCAAADPLHVCGPKPLLDAVLAKTAARGWGRERVHFELFSTPPVESGDHAFEVVLAQSGRSYTVPAHQSVLDCLIEHGEDPLFDCKRGECGVCTAPVLEGDIDHRDYVLSDAEKASGKVMQICVSRCRGKRLVLDL
ncbi:MAG: PDR/VanB family oxidoreductase [Betaproteobacteria bacterium]